MSHGSEHTSAANWSFVTREDGIIISKKNVGLRVQTTRAEAVIEADPARVVSAFLDSAKKPNWVYLLKSSTVVEATDNNTTIIEHSVYQMPVTGLNRDIVAKHRLTYNPQVGSIDVIASSMDGKQCPKVVGKRMQINFVLYRFVPTNAGKFTEFTAFVNIDPRGRVPALLINRVATNYPIHTIKGLRKYFHDIPVTPHPKAEQITQEILQTKAVG